MIWRRHGSRTLRHRAACARRPRCPVQPSYAEKAAGDEAPTHRLLAAAVAGDDRVLDVVAAAPPDRRHPNNLFAAVRFLLLGGLVHPLGDFYAHLGSAVPTPAADDRDRIDPGDEEPPGTRGRSDPLASSTRSQTSS